MILVTCAIVVVVALLFVWTWYHPESFLIPLNLLYNTDSSSRTLFYSREELNTIFPAHTLLESQWEAIRDEGQLLYNYLPDKSVNYLNNYHMNLGSETKKQWTTIELRVFGKDYDYYTAQCPILGEILANHPEIKSCMFSIMEPGKIIEPHVGPYDGLLRYQLPLDIPVVENSTQECYLYVGNEKHQWENGKGILFDEANLHGAVNTTSKNRMVLLIDVNRPYNLSIFRLLNNIMLFLMGLAS